MSNINRRLFLGALGALGGTALFPRLAHAQAAPPKRLLVLFTPNGSVPDAWNPTGTETNFTFGPILDPLTPFKSKIVVVENIEMRSAYNGPGDDHMKGMGHMLTGTELLPGNIAGGGGTPSGLAGGISIDQHIANAVGKTRIKSMEFGVQVRSSDIWSRMVYAGANQPVPPIENPMTAYTQLFANSNIDAAALQRLVKRRQSVLDHAKKTLSGLETRTSSADRQRIQNHSESIRSIEKQLTSQAGACIPPTMSTIDANNSANYQAVGRLQIDLIASAFSCDQTRVASLQFSRSVSNQSFPSLGFTDGHHDLSHDGDDNQTTRDKLIKINNYYAKEVAYLLGKLDGMLEADGSTVLDNTMVVWMNELAKGNAHSHSPMPVLIAGGCGKAYTTGRYIKLQQAQPHNNLLVSMGQAMGVNMTTFGNPAYCTGKLAAL